MKPWLYLVHTAKVEIEFFLREAVNSEYTLNF